jgi:hypothetical protein
MLGKEDEINQRHAIACSATRTTMKRSNYRCAINPEIGNEHESA